MYKRSWQKDKERIEFLYRTKYLPAYLEFVALYPFRLKDLEGEIWKDIAGYEGVYQISNYGRVKSLPRRHISTMTRIIKPSMTLSGYLYVSLKNREKIKRFKIHRLVAQAFIPNSENKPTINHKDGNKFNNCVDNLEWQTQAENNQHAVDTGLAPIGVNRNTAKLTNEQVKYIRDNYKPFDSKFGGRALARKFDVKFSTIQNVVQGKTFKNVE